jgi:hypothetical protein
LQGINPFLTGKKEVKEAKQQEFDKILKKKKHVCISLRIIIIIIIIYQINKINQGNMCSRRGKKPLE